MRCMVKILSDGPFSVIPKPSYISYFKQTIRGENSLDIRKKCATKSRNFVTISTNIEDSCDSGKVERRDTNRSQKYNKLSKKVRKTIRSIERLYKPRYYTEEYPKLEPEEGDELPFSDKTNDTTSELDGNYGPVQVLVKKIYKSATGHVYNDTLWKKYAQQLRVVIPLLRPSDLCLVLHSFGKIRFKDKKLLRELFPQIIRNVQNFTCMGLSLVLNSLKRLEAPNYDIIDLVSNQICTNIDKANIQDISLAANSLSYFHVYHPKFWNGLGKALSLRHHQITSLQASLLVAALAKLDIRDPFILSILKSKLRPYVENNELPSNLLTLVMHSFAKLDYEARTFYSSCITSFGNILLENPNDIDNQSHVLFLYTCICLLEPDYQVIEKSLIHLSTKVDHLNNYKMIKLKAVVDCLKYKYPDFVNNLDEELRTFMNTVKTSRTKKIGRKLSRWAFEVSILLEKSGVNHKRNVLFNYIYVDIFIKDLNVAIKCMGPYSYYARSTEMTAVAKIEHLILSLKGFNVFILPYYEWNGLKTKEDKIEYLSKFGKMAASSIPAFPENK